MKDARIGRRCRAIWISDLHLGTRSSRSDLLLDFLETYEAEYLYLVGDVVDGWSLRRSWYWNEILRKSSRGTRVTYVYGNHDEFLRHFTGLMFGGIAVKPEAVHTTADGLALLVLHGDRFDAYIRNARWLTVLGDRASQACAIVNRWLNAPRRRLGFATWSLSAYLKQRVKNAVSFVAQFEQATAAEAKRRGFQGVVCGHVHHAAIRRVDGILYCNDGDWVESCTALLEDHAGRLSILRWADERERVQVARAG